MNQKLKVGDKVRITHNGIFGGETKWCDSMWKFDDCLATITDIDTDGDCLLDIDNGWFYWSSDCLQKVEDKKPFTGTLANVGGVMLDHIIVDGPKTTIYWDNGDETSVVCHEEDEFDLEKGIAFAIVKYAFGNTSDFNEIFKWKERKVNDAEQRALDDLVDALARLEAILTK